MKKTILLSVIAVAVSFYIGACGNRINTKGSGKSIGIKADTEADISFSVLGDIHTNIDHFEEAILTLNSINSKQDALILNGDTVDEGLPNEYELIEKALMKNKKYIPENIIKNIGNHEFFDYKIEVNSKEDVKTFIDRYLEFAGESRVYHDRWINGYHFISLGSEDGNSQNINSVKALISENQIKWLKEKLAEGYEEGKPIFLFLHQNINKTSKGWVGLDNSSEIKKILSKYPEVIVFNSHTHQSLNDENVNTEEPFTVVHTGAVKYTILFNDGKMERVPLNQGLYIEVKGKEVVIRGIDFKDKKLIFHKKINNSN
ncbi:metallophosphoesterase family protein [Clostridium polynesiense]|uniref:metallophosphoesterase family protein n=1 Tax=Clostridium polynesiense TaxID=1325933 RepID=UPI00058BC666|nr:metallophosphoesterase [Clostridium polynesiense]